MHILIILLFIISKKSLAGTTTTTAGNMDYAMTRSSVPDVLDGLVLHMPLRHSGMSYAQDVSPYKLQGIITGATWATGTARGLYFDGVNDNVDCGTGTHKRTREDYNQSEYLPSWCYGGGQSAM